MTHRVPAIKVLLFDLASAVEARKVAPHRYVTKAMREVECHAPIAVTPPAAEPVR